MPLRFSSHPSHGDVPNLLLFIVRHAYGPQDTQPLQSVLIRTEELCTCKDAWRVPNIGVEVHDPVRPATPPTRLALSFRSDEWLSPDNRLKILDMVMAGLPLGSLVMPAAHDPSN